MKERLWGELQFIKESRGETIVAESPQHCPFSIERVFVVRNLPKGLERGGHAHRTTSELMFCTEGRIRLTLEDDQEKRVFVLDSPEKAVLIPPMTWITYVAEVDGSSCTVLASAPYDASDYIHQQD